MTPILNLALPNTNELHNRVHLIVTTYLESQRVTHTAPLMQQRPLLDFQLQILEREMPLLEAIVHGAIRRSNTQEEEGSPISFLSRISIGRPFQASEIVRHSDAMTCFKQIKITSREKACLLREEKLAQLKKCDETFYERYQKAYAAYQERLEEKCPITLMSFLEHLKQHEANQCFVLVKFKLGENKKTAVYDYTALENWVASSDKAMLPHNRVEINPNNCVMNILYFNPETQETNDEILVELIKEARNILALDHKPHNEINDKKQNTEKPSSFGIFSPKRLNKTEESKENRRGSNLEKKI